MSVNTRQQQAQVQPLQWQPQTVRVKNTLLSVCGSSYGDGDDDNDSDCGQSGDNARSNRDRDKHTKSRCRSQSPISSDKINLIVSSQTSKSLDSVEKVKVGDTDGECIDERNMDFSHNRELWQKRATSQTGQETTHSHHVKTTTARSWLQKHTPDLVMDLPLDDNCSPKKNVRKSNLAVCPTGEDDTISVLSMESPTGPESPDMSTAAERFAKQNQCTLKKNTKRMEHQQQQQQQQQQSQQQQFTEQKHDAAATKSGTSVPVQQKVSGVTKPQIKAKPQVLKKPLLSFMPPVSPELLKDNMDSYLPL